MNRTCLSSIILAGLACTIPTAVEAQMFTPVPQANCVITRPRPVVTTQFHPQQVTTYRDVTETAFCQKQVVENVPVTTCKNVTVDEGGYQMVWVPKPVTKQIAQTTVRQQVKTVSVPVQVNRRIPQISTQMVPVQSVQYVEETVPVQMTAFASSCETCGHGHGHAFHSPILGPQLGYSAAPYQVAPYESAMVPSMPAITIPPYQTASSPDAYSSSQTVPARSSAEAYETVLPRNVPTPRNESIAPPPKTSMFTRVPSAASVWQSQSTIAR